MYIPLELNKINKMLLKKLSSADLTLSYVLGLLAKGGKSKTTPKKLLLIAKSKTPDYLRTIPSTMD
jgi:hypothetical protein